MRGHKRESEGEEKGVMKRCHIQKTKEQMQVSFRVECLCKGIQRSKNKKKEMRERKKRE